VVDFRRPLANILNKLTVFFIRLLLFCCQASYCSISVQPLHNTTARKICQLFLKRIVKNCYIIYKRKKRDST